MIKNCLSCRCDKPLTDFARSCRGRLGRRARCRACVNETRAIRLAGIPKQKSGPKPKNPLISSAGVYQCRMCQIVKSVVEFDTHKDRIKSTCTTCAKQRDIDNIQRRRIANPILMWAKAAFNSSKHRARIRHCAHSLTIDEILTIAQSGICVYCDRLLSFTRKKGDPEDLARPTLDCVQPALGYVGNNIVLACARCNTIKLDAVPCELRQIAERLSNLLDKQVVTGVLSKACASTSSQAALTATASPPR